MKPRLTVRGSGKKNEHCPGEEMNGVKSEQKASLHEAATCQCLCVDADSREVAVLSHGRSLTACSSSAEKRPLAAGHSDEVIEVKEADDVAAPQINEGYGSFESECSTSIPPPIGSNLCDMECGFVHGNHSETPTSGEQPFDWLLFNVFGLQPLDWFVKASRDWPQCCTL